MITCVKLVPLPAAEPAAAAIPPAFVCRILLRDLLAAVLDYDRYRRPIPPELRDMLPTVQDALMHSDAWYIDMVYALFSLAVRAHLLAELP